MNWWSLKSRKKREFVRVNAAVFNFASKQSKGHIGALLQIHRAKCISKVTYPSEIWGYIAHDNL